MRLSIVEEPVPFGATIARRAALAAADLVVGFLIAAVVYRGISASVWLTVAATLAYFTIGRVVSDEPLLFWVYQRMRRPAPPLEPVVPERHDVPVGDAASTTA